MAKNNKKINTIRIYYDTAGNTLNVWFDNPRKEHISDETGDEVILNKNRQGKVIGFEKLNYLPRGIEIIDKLPVEVAVS